MTWNVASLYPNTGNEMKVFNKLSAMDIKPDMIFLQEVKLSGNSAITKRDALGSVQTEFAKLGYEFHYQSPEATDKIYDCAIAVRKGGPLSGGAITQIKGREFPDPESRFVVYERFGELFISVRTKKKERGDLDAQLLKFINNNNVVVIAGDFNNTRVEGLDCGELFTGNAYVDTRKRFENLLNVTPLIDLFRDQNPEVTRFSSFQKHLGKESDGRVDYILIREDLTKSATCNIAEKNDYIIEDSSSSNPREHCVFDHVPVFATLRPTLMAKENEEASLSSSSSSSSKAENDEGDSSSSSRYSPSNEKQAEENGKRKLGDINGGSSSISSGSDGGEKGSSSISSGRADDPIVL